MTIETQQLEGRDHWVCPVVLVVEGVLHGSQGPMFYGADVLRASARAWNGRPVVVYHPTMYGHSFADSPEVFNKQKIGVLFNTRFDHRRLKAEAWLDQERVRTVDLRVHNAILKQRPMEVSTGLIAFADDDSSGTWNGVPYQKTLTGMLPDHLAILPDQEGACSIEDGAGLMMNVRVNAIEPLLMPVMVW
ncbi:MAG: hypothetical protein ACOC95_06645 [Planctomycetota bacterium]